MKIIAVYNAQAVIEDNTRIISTGILPDSTIFRNNEDFYIPNGKYKYHVSLGFVLRISRIGKHIPGKFANKYFDKTGFALNFYSPDYKQYCIQNGLDTAPAIAFDKSFALTSHFLEFDGEAISNAVVVLENNTLRKEICVGDFMEELPNFTTLSSSFFTYKIGDLLYINLYDVEKPVLLNETYKLSIGKDEILTCTIK